MLFLVGAELLQMTWDGVSVASSLVSASQLVHVSFVYNCGVLLFAVFLLFSILSFALSISPLLIATQQRILYPICFHD